jgi:hypothetical protein
LKTQNCICLLALLCLTAAACVAQEIPAFEVAGGYTYMNFRPDLSPLSSQNLSGGGGALVWNATPLFGLKAEFSGYTVGNGWTQNLLSHGYLPTSSSSGNLFLYVFGAEVKKHSGKFQPFGEGLFGAAHLDNYAKVVECIQVGCGGGPTSARNDAFAMEWGLGLDIPIANHVQVRPFEVDYLYTHFGPNHFNGYTGSQNNFKYLGGVNFTFGSK